MQRQASEVPPLAPCAGRLWCLEQRCQQPAIGLLVKAANKLVVLRAFAQINALVHLAPCGPDIRTELH